MDISRKVFSIVVHSLKIIELYDKCSLRKKNLKSMNTVSMHEDKFQRGKEDFP